MHTIRGVFVKKASIGLPISNCVMVMYFINHEAVSCCRFLLAFFIFRGFTQCHS